MAIGTGIFLLVVGAILTFAVGDNIEGVDLVMIGYISMAAGVLAIIISLIVAAMGNNSKHTEVVERHSETHVDDRPAEPRDDVRRDQQPR